MQQCTVLYFRFARGSMLFIDLNPPARAKLHNMKTYNEIKSAILSITSTIKPIETKTYDMVHSDGLTQTHQEHIYSEPIPSIRKAIWGGDFTMKEKLELNEALVSKMKI